MRRNSFSRYALYSSFLAILFSCVEESTISNRSSTFIKQIPNLYADFFETTDHEIYLVSAVDSVGYLDYNKNVGFFPTKTPKTSYLVLDNNGNEVRTLTTPGFFAGTDIRFPGEINFNNIHYNGINLDAPSFRTLVYKKRDTLSGYSIHTFNTGGEKVDTSKFLIPIHSTKFGNYWNFGISIAGDSAFHVFSNDYGEYFISLFTGNGVQFIRPLKISSGLLTDVIDLEFPLYFGPGPRNHLFGFFYNAERWPVILEFDYTGNLISETPMTLPPNIFKAGGGTLPYLVVRRTRDGFVVLYFLEIPEGAVLGYYRLDNNMNISQTVQDMPRVNQLNESTTTLVAFLKVTKDGEILAMYVAAAGAKNLGVAEFVVYDRNGNFKFSHSFLLPSVDIALGNAAKLSDGSYMILFRTEAYPNSVFNRPGTLIKLNADGKL